ncbi:MAG: hypothetical protein AAB131_10580 [Actinomycetota bacterium]
MSTRQSPAVLVSLTLLAACGGDSVSTSAPTTASSTTAGATTTFSASTTVVLTTTTVATTVAPTTTTPPTTAAPVTVADLVLRSDGIGPIVFGAPAAETLGTLAGLLGPVTTDISMAYPIVSESGSFTDDTGEVLFEFPFGRTSCFANGWCAQFGGPSDLALQFVGWSYGSDADPPIEPPLVTAAGIGLAARWADHLDAMDVPPGGCYDLGYGDADGISLDLLSTGVAFLVVDAAGNGTPTLPDPADVRVVSMRAGAQVGYLYLDC